jgi:hypothetical protein
MPVSDTFSTPLRMQPPVRRVLVLGLTLSLLVIQLAAGAEQVSATDVKAAFTINFLKFVDWPTTRVPAEGRPYVVAVLNDEMLHRAIEAAAEGQNVDGRAIEVSAVSSGAEIRDAHLLFIGGKEQRRLPGLVRQLEGTGTVTVGDTPGFARTGVVLNLFVADQHVRFEVNTAAASRTGVRLRAQLLRIARIVG